jgi:hypothetical protein
VAVRREDGRPDGRRAGGAEGLPDQGGTGRALRRARRIAATYSRAFFDLQLDVAEAVARLAKLPAERALLDYTNLYARFGLGRDFDPEQPAWREYVAGLRDAADRGAWTYAFYRRRPDPELPPGVAATFGCFAYTPHADGRVRLHFRNAERDGRGPLSDAGRERRAAELAALFAHVKAASPGSSRVAGVSWLYNLAAYRRLFPPAYVATARVVDGRFRTMPLWGQFVDRAGGLRAAPVAELRARLARQATVDGLDRCFPLRVLAVEAPIAEFYAFFGV